MRNNGESQLRIQLGVDVVIRWQRLLVTGQLRVCSAGKRRGRESQGPIHTSKRRKGEFQGRGTAQGPQGQDETGSGLGEDRRLTNSGTGADRRLADWNTDWKIGGQRLANWSVDWRLAGWETIGLPQTDQVSIVLISSFNLWQTR